MKRKTKDKLILLDCILLIIMLILAITILINKNNFQYDILKYLQIIVYFLGSVILILFYFIYNRSCWLPLIPFLLFLFEAFKHLLF